MTYWIVPCLFRNRDRKLNQIDDFERFYSFNMMYSEQAKDRDPVSFVWLMYLFSLEPKTGLQSLELSKMTCCLFFDPL
jgi:hypothetical protein